MRSGGLGSLIVGINVGYIHVYAVLCRPRVEVFRSAVSSRSAKHYGAITEAHFGMHYVSIGVSKVGDRSEPKGLGQPL